jgi:2-oxoglutarate ferredoxin oxidoreductase subunit alpha
MLVVEMNSGQMLKDEQAAVGGRIPVEFYGRLGGMVPLPDEILSEIRRLCYEPVAPSANPRISWMERMDIQEN